MTVPTTNIGLSHIQTEFGGSNPISLSEYYAGGAYVPSGQTNNAATAVPTSGTISIGNFTGATKVTYAASLTSDTIWDVAISPVDAYAGIRLHTDGTVDYRTGQTPFYSNAYTWLTGSGTNADYEARWTTTSGTLSFGTTGTWLVLSTNREWTRNNTSNSFSSQSCTGTLEIRRASSPFTVLATATITLQADVEI